MGGGFILVPAMVYLLGMSQHQAHGTSLATILFIVVLGAAFYSAHGEVNWVIAVELAIGGVFGAIIGAKIANLLSGRQLRRYFGFFLVIIALRMLSEVAYSLAGGPHINSHPDAIATGGLGAFVVLGIGVLTGTLSGLMGVGGGVIMVPAMVLLLGVSQKMAQGISLAVIIPVAISGALIHAKHGNVRSDVCYWLVVGGVLGGLIGARAAMALPPVFLRAIFGIMLLALGSIMAFRQRPRAPRFG